MRPLLLRDADALSFFYRRQYFARFRAENVIKRQFSPQSAGSRNERR